MKEFINISKKEIEGKTAVEVECAGNMQILSSMLFSAMKKDEQFAELMTLAVAHFYNELYMNEHISRLN